MVTKISKENGLKILKKYNLKYFKEGYRGSKNSEGNEGYSFIFLENTTLYFGQSHKNIKKEKIINHIEKLIFKLNNDLNKLKNGINK